MQVQKFQSTNYNTNFKAKLQLEGAVDNLSKKAVAKFDKIVKNIGDDNDIVSIYIGEKNTRKIFSRRQEQKNVEKDIVRNISIAALISGRTKQAQIITNANCSKKDDMKNIYEHILKYLESIAE